MKRRPYYVHWIGGILFILLINFLSSFLMFGFDLTADKRYTISDASIEYVATINRPMELTVYLDGDIPVGFRRLAASAKHLANRYHRASKGNFSIHFEIPGEGLSDSAKAILYDSLQQMGIHPTNVTSQKEDQSQRKETLVFPGAVLSSENGQVGIDFLEGQNNLAGQDALINAEAQMEYKITRAIKVLQRTAPPVVGYLWGNGEILDLRVYDLIENVLKKEYGFGLIHIDSVSYIPSQFDILLVNRPNIPFNDNQKLKLDQYLMHGGKIVWALDNVYASLDSLQKSNGSFLAFDMGLNLDDLLFKYGVRINRDLVQDLESDQVPSIVGNMGNQPQIQLLPWPYAPLVADPAYHPISRNLDRVLTAFPQSIDTVTANGISKSILLSSSVYSRRLPTPALVEWKPVKSEADLKNFSEKNIPIAMLLEGKFVSAFKNRMSAQEQTEVEVNTGVKYVDAAMESTQMIVVADGDMFTNPISETDGPLDMGSNRYTRIKYGNKEFLKNILFYLSDGKELLSSRAKNFQLRLLDKEKLGAEQVFWKCFNLLVPVLLPLLCLMVVRFNRKRKYSSSVAQQA
jgi:gliding-associated putative ABC transporter substrate-binding component GldG